MTNSNRVLQGTAALVTLIFGAVALAHAQTPQAARSPAQSQSVSERMKSAIPAAAFGGLRKHRKDDRGVRPAHGFIADTNAGPFTTIDAPRAGLFTIAFGIENDGRTVGGYVDTDGRLHGFLRTAYRFRTIDFPGAGATFATRINARGQIVGGYSRQRLLPALELSHGFLFEDGRFMTIDVPGAVRTQAFGINNNGQVVGEYVDTAGRTHGFVRDGDNFTTIDVPGATATFAYDIDDNGRVLGFSFDGAAFHGFLRDPQGAFTAIDMPGAEERGTLTFGFNNRDQIVGIGLVLDDAQLITQAFVLENGRFTPLEAPETGVPLDVSDQGQFAGVYDFMGHGFLRDRQGAFTTIDPPEGNINEVIGINNRGQIVGRYVDAQSRARGFVKDKRGFRPIDVPGAMATSTFQINDRGQIVGNYSTTANNTAYPTRGFMFEDGVFTLIDVPGSQHTTPVSIDNRGRIVGEYQDAAGAFHGFVRDPDGSFTTVDAPQAAGGTALAAINDRGQMLGGYVDASGMVRIFQLEDGKFTVIDPPRGTVAFQPFAINNRGDIVGLASDGVRIRGVLLSDGRFRRITPPGAFVPWLIGTFATDIDERGRIAGTSL